MCVTEKPHECECHGECGCDAPVEDKIRAIELSRELLLLRAGCLERKIRELKNEGAGSKPVDRAVKRGRRTT